MNKKTPNWQLATDCIHGRQHPEPSTGAIMQPIFQTSTYVQSAPGEHQGHEYSRSSNPTRSAFENAVAALECGHTGFAFASGMAAITTLMMCLNSGDHVVVCDDVYGGTYRLFHNILAPQFNVSFSFVDATDLEHVRNAMQDNTRLIWVESPSNPLLKLVDLEGIVDIARQQQCLCACDNTFATPIIQQPLTLGFDIVMHSATKYLNGHSDIVGGVIVIGDRPELVEKMAYQHNAIGAILGPMDSFLALRGIKTLAVRMAAHNHNAMALASWLESLAMVKRVYYPGLSSHPQHTLAKKQMRGFGGMISVELDADVNAIKRMLSRTRLFALAESLGGVESLIEHPGIMTHAAVPAETRAALGITDGLIRLSVGIEALDDLKADLTQALEGCA